MAELKICPKCGKAEGYWSSHRLTQYYTPNGEPRGYSLDGVGGKYVHCLNCGKKIELKRIAEQEEAHEQ